MQFERASHLLPADIARCDFSFEITSEMVPPYDDPFRDIAPVVPYRKTYDIDSDLFSKPHDSDSRLIFVAKDAQGVRAYIAVSRSWNNYAQINDFAVDAQLRRSGVGGRLMDEAVIRARHHGLPGIRLETQTNNVTACRFYHRYGLKIGGFDKYLYTALGQDRAEIALYWYLFLSAGAF